MIYGTPQLNRTYTLYVKGRYMLMGGGTIFDDSGLMIVLSCPTITAFSKADDRVYIAKFLLLSILIYITMLS